MSQIPRVVALGFFDGVHLGHAALLRRVTEEAAMRNARPCAFTFDRHPSVYLSGTPVPLICSNYDREKALRRQGMAEVIEEKFSEMMSMSWQEFVTAYLAEELGAVHVVAGHDFRFGCGNLGTPERLKALCQELGLGCDIIPPVFAEGQLVSSTAIRQALLEPGGLDRANTLLGRPYGFSGVVAPGKGLGHTLGFPTVNLSFQPGVLVPAHGVYASCAILEDGSRHIAAANIGVRPTVESGDIPNAEATLLDFDGRLYGQRVTLELHRFLRPEQKFARTEELQAAVEENIRQTRDYFAHADLTTGGDNWNAQ